MTNTERLAEALRRIHNLCGGDAWEYRKIALEALAAHEAAAEPAGEAVPLTEFCWLVELFDPNTDNSLGRYYAGFTDLGGQSRSTKDPLKAQRYGSKDAASRAAFRLKFNKVGVWRAVEHGFMSSTPPTAPAAESASIEEWEQELSAVMPADFKDWWQNSRREWPVVAAAVIRSQRADRDLGWEMAAKAAPAAEPLTDEQIESIRAQVFSKALQRRDGCDDQTWDHWFARAIERAHGIGASGGEVQK